MVPLRKRRSLQNERTRGAREVDKYRSIIENAPEILALIGAEGTIECINPHTERVLGYRKEDIQGRNIFEFIHPEDVPRAVEEYSKTVVTEGERVPSILRLRAANGDWIPFEIIANNRLQDPNVRAVIFTARDLRFRREVEDAIRRANADPNKPVEERTTELAKINAELRIENQARRQAESKLRDTVSLLNATLNATADGLLVVSNEGKVTSCNKRFVELWRLSCDFSLGRDDQRLLEYVGEQLQSPNDFLDKVRALYADPSATSFDLLHFKDGRIFERYSQPQLLADKVVGRVWSFRDVTLARNLEAELRQSQKMEALGRLAGGIAHDFNNLLMLISGYVTQLLSHPSTSEVDGISEQLLELTKRAAAVTRQLLAFSRKLPATPTIADLNVIVLDMERMLRRLLSDQIQLQISIASDPQLVYIDVSQIELMIMNLAINAQDAMPDGGLLSIATKSEVPTDTSKQRGNAQGIAILQVSDTGHGMTAEIQAHIFEPFFTTKQLGKGTGLGLSTVLGIAERAGGRIKVQSELGHGTTFQVYFPRASTALTSLSVDSATVAPRAGTETILLAEDEPGIRAMTRSYLESLGYLVLEAADGAEAIRLSLEYSGVIHIVLSDILMPGIKGDAAVAEIRKHRPEIKAIFMSGYMGHNLAGESDAILYKPFEFPELGRRVRSALDVDAHLGGS